MQVLLCHPQTQHSKKLAEILYANSNLYKFVNPSRIARESASKIPNFLRKKFESRIIDLPEKLIENNIALEIYRLFQQKVLKNNDRAFYYKYREHYQNSIKDSDIEASDAVISYDSSSWILGERMRKLSKPFILERTIAHHGFSKKAFNVANKKYPEWSMFYERENIHDSYIALENRELELADYIVAGSSFVKKSLIDIGTPETKIIVNPYGVVLKGLTNFPDKKNEILTFLFLGTISARKGVPTLLSAWSKLGATNAKLIVAGFGSLPSNLILPKNMEYIGAIHPDDRNDLFKKSDVFVFPSLLEGMAQVLVEAAVCGLPIIATDTSGAGEIVEDGINGFIIESNDEEALVDRMKYFIENPSKAKEMGNVIVDKIRDKFSIDSYGQRWSEILSRL